MHSLLDICDITCELPREFIIFIEIQLFNCPLNKRHHKVFFIFILALYLPNVILIYASNKYNRGFAMKMPKGQSPVCPWRVFCLVIFGFKTWFFLFKGGGCGWVKRLADSRGFIYFFILCDKNSYHTSKITRYYLREQKSKVSHNLPYGMLK